MNLFEFAEQQARASEPQPGEVVFKRTGFSDSVAARIPGVPGGYATIHPNHPKFFPAGYVVFFEFCNEPNERGVCECYSESHATPGEYSDAVKLVCEAAEAHGAPSFKVSPYIEAAYYYSACEKRQTPEANNDWYKCAALAHEYEQEWFNVLTPDGALIAEFVGDGLCTVDHTFAEIIRRTDVEYSKGHHIKYDGIRHQRLWAVWLLSQWMIEAGAPWVWRRSIECDKYGGAL